jgi:hypothetical protein
MVRRWRSLRWAGAGLLVLGLTQGNTPARAQAPTPAPASPWGNYATTRAAPWNAYASRPSAWSNYVYRGTASSGVSATGARDLAPRHLAYGYRFNAANGHWEHPGYGGSIPNYAHAGRPTKMPRPWVWWGSQTL